MHNHSSKILLSEDYMDKDKLSITQDTKYECNINEENFSKTADGEIQNIGTNIDDGIMIY